MQLQDETIINRDILYYICLDLEYSSGLLEGLDEFPSLSSEFLNLDSFCNWQGEIEDLDTDTLVR